LSNFFSRWFCYVALSVLLACFSTLCAEAQVSEITLDNGMRVIIAESHSVPIVAIDAWLSAGTRRESPNQAGVAHFLEHVLFKGTPTHPDEESVDGSIEDLGGTLNAATSYDWAHFYTEVPSAGCNDAITLLADILQHASLKQAAIDEERPIILDEVARDADDPLTSLTDTVRTLTYAPSCAYGRPITGSADAVREVTRDEIVHFYATYYAPNNLTLVVSGDVSPAEVQKCVSAEFGNWKKSTTLPLESSAERSSYRVVDSSDQPIQKSLIQKDANQSYLVMGFKAPSVAEQPDSWDMDVLLTMLGQGGNNRLTEQLKDKAHLVDTISADYLTLHADCQCHFGAGGNIAAG
jgi:zinc protease